MQDTLTLPNVSVTPKLLVKFNEAWQPLLLSHLDIRAVITGFIAETTLIMTFRNQFDRVLEGQLYFPLPEGATVCGYGLDVEGEIVDGVVVEKHQARIAFETEMRRPVVIDPGLVEWVKGNNFKTRVWPIPAWRSRTIKIQYVSDLLTKGGEAFYYLPLKFDTSVADFQLQVEVVKGNAPPQVCDSHWREFYFERKGSRYIAKTHQKNIQPASLLIAMPEIFGQQVLVEKDNKGQHYFCINDFPQSAPTEAVKPQRIGILWDASLSREVASIERELRLLQQLLAQLGNIAVDVIVVRNVTESPVSFRVTNGNASQLLQYLQTLPCDGATNFGAIKIYKNYQQFVENIRTEAETSVPPDYDFYLLFSDGLGNLGQELPQIIEAPVYAISSEVTANHPLLRHLAIQSGGAYFNLQRLSDNEVLASLGKPVFAFLGADYNHNHVAEVYPAVGQPVQGRFTLVGKLKARQTKITLKFGYGDRVTQQLTYILKKANPTTTNLIPRYWAQQKIADLMVFPDRNKKELIALGRAFGLVTPGTSLLVLETLQQHLQHKIVPPKSRKRMYQQYMRLVKQLKLPDKLQPNRLEKKIERIVAQWIERVGWWNTKFEYPQDFRVTSENSSRIGGTYTNEEFIPIPMLGTYPNAELIPTQEPSAFSQPQPTPMQALSKDDLQYQRFTQKNTWTGGSALYSLDVNFLNDRPEFRPPMRAAKPVGSSPMSLPGRLIREYFDAFDDNLTNDFTTPPAEAVFEEAALDPNISFNAWNAQTTYLHSANEDEVDEAYNLYLRRRPACRNRPAFYFDCAENFFQKGQRDMALRILTSVAELELDNPQLLRMVAYKLDTEGELDLAIDLFEQVLNLRPEEPQSYRDLALVLAKRQEYERAIELLNQVVIGNWDSRFDGIEFTALMDLNRLIALVKQSAAHQSIKIPVDRRLLQQLDVDIRVVLTRNTDMNDIYLKVIEPSGEHCNRNQVTTIGGMEPLRNLDFCGPEEYLLRKAMPGTYTIQVDYFGFRQEVLTDVTTLFATIYINFGRPNELCHSITLHPSGVSNEVATIEIKSA
jgi:tetratricopeptide (TPR) repeat protein